MHIHYIINFYDGSHVFTLYCLQAFTQRAQRCYPTGDPDVNCSAGLEQNPRGGATKADEVSSE